jgi:hypothetical protein
MLIEQRSPVTGKVNVMDIPVTIEQLERWQNGELIQNAMPHLTPDEREFLISGCTPEDWNEMFAEEE